MARTSRKYQAALFDFDGTLTPSLPLWIKAIRMALSHHGHELNDEQIVTRYFYRDWKDIAEELGLESVESLRDAIHDGLRHAFAHAELFPEVLPLLERCRADGVLTALVTSAPRLVLDLVMPRLGLSPLFDCVVCADDVAQLKPHAEPLHRAPIRPS
jgi:beta-phosphoglucomutase-like phosphatase (HAD superfamily)